MGSVFLGHDWAESHHDVFLQDEAGNKLASARLSEGVAGIRELHELLAEHVEDPGLVTVATETDRGLFVAAMVDSGYRVLAINPLSVDQYRKRLSTSGAKSDQGDAKVLAEIARIDGNQHRAIAGDSEQVLALQTLTRAHHSMIWSIQRQSNQLRSTLREFYPAALEAFKDLASAEALAILEIAPTPSRGRLLSLSKIESALTRAGRQRRIAESAAKIQAALRAEQLNAPPLIEDAMGASVSALVAVIATMRTQISMLESQLAERFDSHPDAKIIRSLPGLGMILSARVLAEFGDDPNRYDSAKSRKNYAGTSPITRASGKMHVVLARYARNKHLGDACYIWAFASLTKSPGARAYYDEQRAKGSTHNKALRALANRLVGIFHGCLQHHTPYDEQIAWSHRQAKAA